MRTTQMALLTHDALVLPQGRLEVPVVDSANLQTVADVFKNKYQLVVGMFNGSDNPPCYSIVTQCDIIDFNQLDDNSLSITLEGKQRLYINAAEQQLDKRWLVKTKPCSNWQEVPIQGEFELLSLALKQFYEANPQLEELYPQLHLEDGCWVSQRWLEVLPMYNRDKIKLLRQPNCHQTMAFILRLIKSHA